MKRMSIDRKKKEALTAYLMLLPDTIGLGVFVFVPMLFALYTSFHSWNGMTPMKFIGLENYTRLIGDRDFWASLLVTLRYSIIYIPAVYVVSLGLALILNQLRGKLELIARMSYFLPYSISTVVAGLLWSFLYDPKNGYLNSILVSLGLPRQMFLASSSQALVCIIVVSVWLIVGYNMTIFLSALKQVPKDFYEAAELDGANVFQRFFHITLPGIQNTTLFILVVTTIGSFQVFDQIKVMTDGGPAKATEVTVFHIYNQAFTLFDFGYSSTMAVVLLIIIMILSLIQFRAMGRKG